MNIINKIKLILQKVKRTANATITLFVKEIMKIFKDPQTNWLNIIILMFTIFFMIFVLIYLPLGKKFIFLSNTQIFYIFSTSAQSIAGLFGLSIAGYAFFNNYLDKEIERSADLESIIPDLKTKYYKTIRIMSIFAITSIVLSIYMMYFVKNKSLLVEYIMNFAGVAIVSEIVLIIYFVCDILNPNRFYNFSVKIKQQEDKEHEDGDFAKFTQSFNEIISIMHEFILELQKMKEYKSFDIRKYSSNNQKAFFFLNNEIISRNLF